MTCRPPPVAIATATEDETPLALAIDGTNAYWTTDRGRVMTSPLAGGPSVVLATAPHALGSIAVDDDRVYYANAVTGQIMAVAIAGGEPVEIIGPQAEPLQIVVRDGVLYWTTSGFGFSIRRMTLPGGAPEVLAEQQSVAAAIAVTADRAYWTSTGAGQIRSRPLDLSAPVATIAADQHSPISIAVRDGTAYWANDGGSHVVLSSSPGGEPTVIGRATDPTGVAVDDSHVYWTDAGSHTVVRAPRAGGRPDIVAGEQWAAFGVQVDADAVYWANGEPGGAIMKLGK